MIKVISRRALLNGIGQTAAIGSLAALLPRDVLAAQPAAQGAKPAAPAPGANRAPAAGRAPAPAKAAPPPPMNICLQMLYPSGEGLTFDADAFRDRHIGVLKAAYAGGLERVELRVPPPPVAGRAPPPLLAAVSMYISDFSKFAAGASANGKDVNASMAAITKSAPMAQFDSVLAGVGATRDTVTTGASSVSWWFESKEGARMDAKGLAETYLPKLLEAAGAGAIRRVEVTEGIQSANGSKPLMLGNLTLYIADETAFDTAMASDAVKAVTKDFGQYFSAAVPPIQTLMQVHAAG